ncbi:MAG: sigma-54-dependent Fis family transcriptional regulator [Lunatimonas sp.]|uniref:sigma-54-dependent transcriptional regulator n=1 Tax=Lunatimonas sp. TaxID=2060141 RepID=UPI00263B2F53|nr:sigma-54 dependent transcriptional regulator [Lunatimonas sp.]MCC5939192.1 sigma-54-dependent Fis family transcriptional regulator [Lunatimonas sp.]
MSGILLIEDDLTYSKVIRKFLEKNSFSVTTAITLKEAHLALKKITFSLVITDYRLPDGTGMELLEYCNVNLPDLPVILITNYSDIRTAVRSMKLGAVEYITKPINPDELLLTVKEALSIPKQVISSQKSTKTAGESYFVGESLQAQNLEKQINLVAPTDMSVLVLGESGTGKEFISKRIHQKSLRKDGPFVAVDCGALSAELAASELFGHVKGAFTGAVENKTGHFEAADKGTLFLDEIGNLSYEIQIKLLRAIQERRIRKVGGNKDIPVDVRIIAATNDALRDSASTGSFREDLYYRINEFSIHAAPLRERTADFDGILSLFLQQSNEKLNKHVTGLSEEVSTCFKKYPWPGNLRELKNVVRRAVLLTGEGEIQLDAIPEELTLPPTAIPETQPDQEHQPEKQPITSTEDLRGSFEDQERALIIQTLESVRHNKSQAAKILKMDRKTLYAKIEKYGIYS